MEASVDFGAIYFLVCQSAVHTLTLGLRAWREARTLAAL